MKTNKDSRRSITRKLQVNIDLIGQIDPTRYISIIGKCELRSLIYSRQSMSVEMKGSLLRKCMLNTTTK